MTIGRRAGAACTALAGLAALSLGATATAAVGGPAGGPPQRHSAAAGAAVGKGKASGWSKLTSGAGISSPTSIGLARFEGSVEAVWTAVGDSSSSIQTRSVDDSGQPAGAVHTVVSGWLDLNNFPAVYEFDGVHVVAFSGLKSTDGSDPYSQGYEYLASSQDGASWTVGAGALSGDTGAYGSYGSDAINAHGTQTLVYTKSSASAVSYHAGTSETIPETPYTDPRTSDTGGSAYFAGIGYDDNSGETWTVWASNSGKKGTDGVSAQRIEPSRGNRVHAPKSTKKVHGGYASNAALQQRIQVASPTTGGVYAAYPVGYPTSKKVALWQLGSGHALVVKAGGDAARVDAAGGNSGSLWLTWWDNGAKTIAVAHTNGNGTAIATRCTVALPPHTDTVSDIEGEGVGNKLSLFVVAGSSTASSAQIYSQLVGCSGGQKHHG